MMHFAVAAAGLAAVANAAQINYGAYAPPVYGGYAPPANETTTSSTSTSTTMSHTMYTTEVLTALTTYCPSPTAITHGSMTYTITEATTLTITNCPCTVTKPVYSSVVTICHTWYNRTCISPGFVSAC